MKFFAVFFVVAFFGYVSANNVLKPTVEFKIADKDFLLKQKKVYDLLNHITQHNYIDEQVKYAQEYNFLANKDNFLKPEVFNEFAKLYKRGFLPKYKIFSLSYDKYRDEAIALFNLFFYAKDFETFHKTACWAREHMNEGLFVYSFTIAVLHRTDCQGIRLPEPYEIYPFYFVNSDVMEKVNHFKTQGSIPNIEDAHLYGIESAEKNVFTIYNNYSTGYEDYDVEQKLSYFTDDIGLNTYYYYFHHDYPYWMAGKDFGLDKDRRGELYYYVHQQILARYYLERLSNGLGPVDKFSWYRPIKTGFNPNVKHHNGYAMPIRPDIYDANKEDNTYYVQEVDDYTRRIRQVIDQGFITLYDGTLISLKSPKDIEALGRFVEGNKDLGDYKFFDYLAVMAKYLLGAGVSTHYEADYVAGAMEQFQTAMRDPMFYQLYNRCMRYFYRFKNSLPAYTKNEISYQGVKIDNVRFTPIVTYKEDFDYDITTGSILNKEEIDSKKEKYTFYARQARLNHKPFSVTYDVTSEKDADVSVRLFLGPKCDNFGHKLSMNDNKYNFFELDHFRYSLRTGQNAITRKNIEFGGTAFDSTKARNLYQTVTDALAGKGEFRLDQTEAHNGWPLRLLMPKGREGGMKFQVYAIVTPFQQPKVPRGTGYPYVYASGVGSGARYTEDLAFGFPLDRPIDESNFFYPNMFLTDVTIDHVCDYKSNVVPIKY